ncbi:Bbp19 family protein [Pseudothauera rhizosphaerae]|uniref:Endopeptidase n=1 Tax=Pseudothauera rhizosphaerae TaxID=2565932 RepID=A0A4S4AWB3_9RHOO|nr:endopeptidase [Pseudothauera rhizosphaerae]THF64320.1 endopeptidase [Pseudothauera rhizosphaerae]
MTQFDPFDLRGQERKQRRDEERAQFRSQRDRDDFEWLMNDKRGRRIVWRLLERTGVFRSSFTGNSETFFREGERNVGLLLMAMIHESAPEQYATMLEEAKHGSGNDDDGSPNDH